MAPFAFAGESRWRLRRPNGEGDDASEIGNRWHDIQLEGATLNRTLLSRSIRESGFLVEGGVNQAGHECVFLPNGRWEQSPPLAVNDIFLCGFVRRTPHSPLQTGGTKQLVPMDERVVFGRVEFRDACLAKVFELDVAAHELAHVILEGFGTEGHFGRKRMHASRCASQCSAGTLRCRRIEKRTGKNGVRRAPETSSGGWWTVSVRWSRVDRLTAKSWDCGIGVDRDINVGIWGSGSILGDGWSVDLFRRVDHRRRASAGTSRAALACTARGSGGARRFRDVAVEDQKANQDGM
jgi:hypothetical protein